MSVDNFTAIPSTVADVGDPVRSTDMNQVITNLDALDAAVTAITAGLDNAVNDHFLGTAISSTWWITNTGGSGTVAIISEHSADFQSGGIALTDFLLLTPTTDKMFLVKTEEYAAYMEIRVKLTGNANNYYTFGFNDNSLSAQLKIQTTTDFVGIKYNAGPVWRFKSSNSGGGTDTYDSAVTPSSWNTMKVVLTASATAGSRKVECYANGTLETTFSTNANIPTATLRPVIGCSGDGATTTRMKVDYIKFGFSTFPVAA